MVLDQHRRGLPGGLQWRLAAESTNEVLTFSEVTRAMRPRNLEIGDIVWRNLRRVTEVPTALIRAGQRPTLIRRC